MLVYKFKVSLIAYLFLLFPIFNVAGQQDHAWLHHDYVDIFELNLEVNQPVSTPVEAYLAGYKTGLKTLIEENPSPALSVELLDKYSEAINNSALEEPYKQYYINDLFLLQAMLELKAGNEIKFMWMMNQLYKKSDELMNKYPDFEGSAKIFALLQIMIGSVPDQYQWIFNLLGFDGNAPHGVKLLKELSESGSKLRFEGVALYHLVTNYMQPELEGNSIHSIEKYLEKNPDHYLHSFIAGLSLIKQHNSLKARKYFNKIIKSKNIPVAEYFIAETYLHQSKYDKALQHYLNFIDRAKGENLKKDSYFKIFIIHYINGNSGLANQYKFLALKEGNSRSEADKNADEILGSKELPDPVIFKIRYFTDGGFYDEAHKMLDEAVDLSAADQVELIYRRARLNHLDNNPDKAIQDYKQSITLYDGRYFAPNSALQLAYIYQEQGNNKMARNYFEKVLEYKNYSYENSLRSKAKSGLKSIKQ